MNRLLAALLLSIAAGCATGPRIDTTYTAASQDSRAQFLILHFTASGLPASLATLTLGPVSSHYLVNDDPPTVYRLVDESRRAWHAGDSSWQGNTQLNAASIGIEIVNAGSRLTPDGVEWSDYPPQQIDAVIALVKDIARRHDIRPDRILGHSDVAPLRKVDPGPKFPWKRLADEGLVPWPDASRVAARRAAYEANLPDVAWFQARLAAHGFAVAQTGKLDAATQRVVAAFQMKYRPQLHDGDPDAETAALLDVLTSSAWEARLDAELAAIAQDRALPLASLAVAAVREGNVSYERQFGRRRIDARDAAGDRPADAQTLYRVASISKFVTALAVMRLVEAGTLALDRDVSGYLGYRLRNPHFPDDAITLRMLLSHTSSLRDDGGYFWDARVALRDVLLPGGSLHGDGAMWARDARPGAYFTYANLPWGVIGAILETTTGERFDRLMKRLVLDPLGVPGGYNPAELSRSELANLATLYRKADSSGGKEVWNPGGPWIAQVDDHARAAPVPRAGPDYRPGRNGTLFAPQGGLRTSAAGLARILRMFLDGGRSDGKVFLKPETIDAMLAQQWRHDPSAGNGDSRSEEGHRDLFNAWGLGVQHFLDLTGPARGDRLVEGGGYRAAGHLGDAYGLAAAFVFDRATRSGMVYLIGGIGADPQSNPGRYSALHRHEERILTALFRRALRQSPD